MYAHANISILFEFRQISFRKKSIVTYSFFVYIYVEILAFNFFFYFSTAYSRTQ